LQRPLAHCPVCSSPNLEPVVEVDAEEVHFLCRDCRRCWHVELGFVHRMGPHSCTGCPHSEECEAVDAANHTS
jgi:hypothetical protein